MRLIRSAVFSLALLVLSPIIALAQNLAVSPSPRFSPAPPFSKSSEDPYLKEPFVYELDQTTVHFETSGVGSRDLIFRQRIQSESAVHEFGLLVYRFSSRFETLDVVYVRVRKPDGTVVDTPPTDVQELDSAVSREAPMYTDEREKHIAIKSLSVGDVLEADLHWTLHDPVAPGHFWFDYSYFHAGICLKEILAIDVPRNIPVKLRNCDPQSAAASPTPPPAH
jgi:Domain of Unknown Function with PDB structure (DUF3857)